MAPIEVVFDVVRDIDVHQRSQISKSEKAVAGKVTGLIEKGEWVTWEAKHFGVRQRLTSRIEEMRRPVYFRDSMVRGAFKRFDHEHHFETTSAGHTKMIDVFDYTSHLGLLGKVADVLFLKRYMHKLLWERNLTIKEVAESKEIKGSNK